MERVNVLLGMYSGIILQAFATLSVIQTRPQGRRISVLVQEKLGMDTFINVANMARVTMAAVTARTVMSALTAASLLLDVVEWIVATIANARRMLMGIRLAPV